MTRPIVSSLLSVLTLVALLAPSPAAAQAAAAPVEGLTPREGAVLPGAGVLPRTGPVRDRTAVDPDFLLGPGDVLSISVLEDPSLDTQALVRPDGGISVPLAGELMVAGRTPAQVSAAIRRALSPSFVDPPTVNVALSALALEDREEEDFLTVYVLGEVNNPGGFQVEEPVGLLQAMALAGGPGIFAARKRVQVRQTTERGVEQVILVDYEAIEEGAAAPRLMLGDGDTVVVPERGLFE